MFKKLLSQVYRGYSICVSGDNYSGGGETQIKKTENITSNLVLAMLNSL